MVGGRQGAGAAGWIQAGRHHTRWDRGGPRSRAQAVAGWGSLGLAKDPGYTYLCSGCWVEGPREGSSGWFLFQDREGIPWCQALAWDTGCRESQSQARPAFCTCGCISEGQAPTFCLSAAPIGLVAPSLPVLLLHLQRWPLPCVPRTALWASLQSCAAPRAMEHFSKCRRQSSGCWRA